MAVLEDLVAYLEAEGHGTRSQSLFAGRVPMDDPGNPVPDAIIALLTIPGMAPLLTHESFAAAIEQPMIQVLTRGTPYGDQAAMVRAMAAWDTLGSVVNLTLSGTLYLAIQARQSPWKLRDDAERRPEYVFNILVQKAL
jgi:hypothetical protein